MLIDHERPGLRDVVPSTKLPGIDYRRSPNPALLVN